MKTRKGIDDDHLTYLDAGRIAQETGRAPRSRCTGGPWRRPTPARPTGRRSRGWSSTSTSRCSATATSGRPPTPCGWSSRPAPAGVVVGRGCLGRPWLFRDLAAALRRRRGGDPARRSARCATMMRRHAELLCQHMGEERGCKEFRKHVSWYLKGFAAGGDAAPRAGPGHHAGRARRAARRAGPGRAVPGRRAGHAARAPGLAARAGRAPRGLARRHRRHRRAAAARTPTETTGG